MNHQLLAGRPGDPPTWPLVSLIKPPNDRNVNVNVAVSERHTSRPLQWLLSAAAAASALSALRNALFARTQRRLFAASATQLLASQPRRGNPTPPPAANRLSAEWPAPSTATPTATAPAPGQVRRTTDKYGHSPHSAACQLAATCCFVRTNSIGFVCCCGGGVFTGHYFASLR